MKKILLLGLIVLMPLWCSAETYFAELDSLDTVTRVIVMPDIPYGDYEAYGQTLCRDLTGTNSKWVQTFKADTLNPRKRFAGEGMRYDVENQRFILPKPFLSWQLDAEGNWQAPVSRPTDGKLYQWNETAKQWSEVILPWK
jgi:hypothetical protein